MGLFSGSRGGEDILGQSRNAALSLAGTSQEIRRLLGYGDARLDVGIAGERARRETAVAGELGGGIRDVLLGIPEIAAGAQALTGAAGETGPSDIEQELRRTALMELLLGDRLSPGEQRQSQQDARAAYAARGLEGSPASAAAEVLGLSQFRNQRLRERQGFAAGVDAQGTARRATDAGIGEAALRASTAVFDPFSRVFGPGGSRTSGTSFPSPYIDAGVNVAETQAEYDFARDTQKRNLLGGIIGGVLGAF